MLIYLKQLAAGPKGVFPAGSVIEVTPEEAAAFIRGGYAEAASPTVGSVIETAMLAPPEKMILPRGRPKMSRGKGA